MRIDDEEKERLMGFERSVDFRSSSGWIVDDAVRRLLAGLGRAKPPVKALGGLSLLLMRTGKGESRELSDRLGSDMVFFRTGTAKPAGPGTVVED